MAKKGAYIRIYQAPLSDIKEVEQLQWDVEAELDISPAAKVSWLASDHVIIAVVQREQRD
jgi:hypothetical protein